MENKVLNYQIVKHIGLISACRRGDTRWKKELNIVSWNHRTPVYDVREWNESHTQMSKGITLTGDEVKIIYQLLQALETKEEAI